jgi:hypothetical protein
LGPQARQCHTIEWRLLNIPKQVQSARDREKFLGIFEEVRGLETGGKDVGMLN